MRARRNCRPRIKRRSTANKKDVAGIQSQGLYRTCYIEVASDATDLNVLIKKRDIHLLPYHTILLHIQSEPSYYAISNFLYN